MAAWEAVTARGRARAAVALNAGIGVSGRFDQTALDDDLTLVDLNVRSTVHLAKLAARSMVDAGQGRILVTSSVAAATPGPITRRTRPRRPSFTRSPKASGTS